MAIKLEKNKLKCDECGWRCTTADVDYVVDPRPLPGQEPDNWMVCPACRTPEHFKVLCDEPGCIGMATCGWNDRDEVVYRNTCYTHYQSLFKGL